MKKEVNHFYYSEEQAFIESGWDEIDEETTRTHFNTFIDENGKERIYTEVRVFEEGENPEPNDNFSDFQYLGTGTIYTVNGIKQNINNNIEITETVQDASYSHFSHNFYKKLLFKKLNNSSKDTELEPQIEHNNVEIKGDPALESELIKKKLESVVVRDIELPDIDVDLEPQIEHNNVEIKGDPQLESMVVSQLLEKKINDSQSKESHSVDVNLQLLKDFEMPKSLKDAHKTEYDKDILNKFKNRKPK